MYNTPNIKCWTGVHSSFYVPTGLIGIGIWGIFFPIVIAVIIKRILKKHPEIQKNRNEDEIKKTISGFLGNLFFRKSNIEKKPKKRKIVYIKKKDVEGESKSNGKADMFKFFYKDYHRNFYYWESILFLQKFSLSLLPNITQFLHQEKIDAIYFVILLVYLYFLFYEPFLHKFFNRIEKFSIFVSIITRISMMFSIAFQKSSVSFVSLFFTVFCLILNAIFYGIGLYYGFKLINWKKELLNAGNKLKSGIKNF